MVEGLLSVPRALRAAAAVLLLSALACPPACVAAPSPTGGRATSGRHIAILCYHDLSDSLEAPLQTVPAEFLRQQIRACRAAGWTFVSMARLLAARDHPEALPPRTMVLTFDDGYRSFRDSGLPLLRQERVPATIGVITSFVDHPPAGLPPLMTWSELRDVARDTLVDVESHTHALHRYETMNPYRDTAPSVATRRYLLAEARYENREEYRARLRADLDTTRRVLRERLGIEPMLLVWPYGMHNEMARGLAEQAGFRATLALGGREVTRDDLRSGCLPRIMVTRRLRFDGDEAAWLVPPATPVRAVDIDLDDAYSRDPAVFRDRVARLVQRARAVGATHAFMGVCSDTAREGRLNASWCMNHQVFVRADVWSMVAAQLAQARIRVWARVPTLNLTWAWQAHPEWRVRGDGADDAGDLRVGATRGPGGKAEAKAITTAWPTRLSPNLPDAQRAAIDWLTDIAVYAPIDGVVFDDDAAMAPGERLALTEEARLRVKAEAIDDLVRGCRDAVRAWRPECRFARAVDAPAVEASGISPATAQDLGRIVRDNDLAIVVARATSGGPADAGRAIEQLGRRALSRWSAVSGEAANVTGSRRPPSQRIAVAATGRRRPNAPVLVELIALDRASGRWSSPKSLSEQLAAARRAGVTHLGLRPLMPAAGDLPEGLLDAGGSPVLTTTDPTQR